jgi:predicted DNA-binding transcriptional regulator YafY
MRCQEGAVSQTDRLYRLKRWFDGGRCLDKHWLMTALEVSPATLKRDIAHLRNRMNAPVVFDRERGGYRLDAAAQLPGTQYELPGLWFSADEIHALLTMQHLLANLDTGGLLGPHIAPLTERLNALLASGAVPTSRTNAEVARRIKLIPLGARPIELPHFQAAGTALLQRKRLQITYHARSRDEDGEREVSPQRLVHYRDNWYLDAWCHLRRGLRSFAVDAIRAATVVDKAAVDVGERRLDAELGSGYGIFAGRKVQWATLVFSAERARWVASERWHPRQRGRWLADGRYQLRVPYADPRELVMDILRHVPEVEVLQPDALRGLVIQKLEEGVRRITP